MDLINYIDKNFKLDNAEIRVIDISNDKWFVAKDICDILGLTNITNALKNIPEKWVSLHNIKTSYNSQNMNIISEPALYMLIMRSNKQIAQRFQDYVCKEILPSKRKNSWHALKQLLAEKEEQLKESEAERNKLLEKQSKNNNRNFKSGHGVYVGVNELEKDVFKVGITVNPNSRISSLSTGTTKDFKIEKFWKTRFHKQIEDAVKKKFEDYRILVRKEFFEICIYDKVVEYIDKAVEFFNQNDTVIPTPEPEIIPEPNIVYEYVEADTVIFDFIDSNRVDKKACTKCFLYLPLSQFYLRNEKNNNPIPEQLPYAEQQKLFDEKYRSHCKKCHSQSEKELREKTLANPNFTKKECNTCKVLLKHNLFYTFADNSLFDDCKTCTDTKNNLVNSKQCSTCKLVLEHRHFTKDRSHSDGLRTQCKECTKKSKTEKSDNIVCEFCNLKIKYKGNLQHHYKTKSCLDAQDRYRLITP